MRTKFALMALLAAACSSQPAGPPPSAEPSSEPERAAHAPDALQAVAPIAIDGSSTVFPITEAVAEEFQKEHKSKVTIGVSGTGGGFKKLCGGEIALAGASRPIKPTEVELCVKGNIGYLELPVAYDGLAVVVHPSNTWAATMTVADLKKIWAPEAQGKVTKWKHVRPTWPDKEIHLFGAGVDSGTYDYFTKAIVGTEHASRGDFTSSEDDNVLVQGVSGDPLALGFFGYAYYQGNPAKLQLVAIDDGDDSNGKGAIKPSPETVIDGTYQPLSRPIFVYVTKAAAQRSEVVSFIDYYLGKGVGLVAETGYIPLSEAAYGLVRKRWQDRTEGSVFHGEGSKVGVTVEGLLAGK